MQPIRRQAARKVSHASHNIHRQEALNQIKGSQYSPQGAALQKSKDHCYDLVKNHDKSSYLLSHFYPSQEGNLMKDFFVAVKSFQMELNKIGLNSGTSSNSDKMTDLKYEFWKDQIEIVFDSINNGARHKGQPVTDVLSYCASSNALSKDSKTLFLTMINSYKTFNNSILNKGFENLDSVCSCGEGTFSQLNYILFNSLIRRDNFMLTVFDIQSDKKVDELKTTIIEVLSHLGQSQYICNMLIGLKYYSKSKNALLLPIENIAKHHISQEEIIRILQGETDTNKIETLKDIVFDVSTVANDHIITSQYKFKKIKELLQQIVQEHDDPMLIARYNHLNKGIPDSVFLPMMNILSSSIFLKQLESSGFDLVENEYSVANYWKLPFTSYYNYRNRVIGK